MKRKVRNRKKGNWEGRRARVSKRVSRGERTQLTVYRSSKHIYAQLVDPTSGRTLGTISTRTRGVVEEAVSSGKIEAAQRVGRAIAALAREKQIDRVVFNRNGFLYHGRVKALADAAREAGLQF